MKSSTLIALIVFLVMPATQASAMQPYRCLSLVGCGPVINPVFSPKNVLPIANPISPTPINCNDPIGCGGGNNNANSAGGVSALSKTLAIRVMPTQLINNLTPGAGSAKLMNTSGVADVTRFQ